MSDPSQPLREEDVDPDPVRQFDAWFEAAKSAGARQPEAAALATSAADGAPSVRMVLVKQAAHDGFVFFTNYESRKGGELATNPRAALLFHWEPLGRQVRIEGPVQRTTREQSAAYAHSRARGSQLSALASPQSRTISRRDVLERRVAELAERHAGGDVPLPDAWGGFRLMPETFEFWQHRDNRLHDRLRYSRDLGGGWQIDRLAP
ncbi:MAG TPA: pyridoxamine 5'-phosphate oxidase [Solirubrobacteraceae bacterium]